MFTEPLDHLNELIRQFSSTTLVDGGDTVHPFVDQRKLKSQFPDFQQYMKHESMKLWEAMKKGNDSKQPEERLTDEELLEKAGGERVALFWGRPGFNLDYMDEFVRLVSDSLNPIWFR